MHGLLPLLHLKGRPVCYLLSRCVVELPNQSLGQFMAHDVPAFEVHSWLRSVVVFVVGSTSRFAVSIVEHAHEWSILTTFVIQYGCFLKVIIWTFIRVNITPGQILVHLNLSESFGTDRSIIRTIRKIHLRIVQSPDSLKVLSHRQI